MKAALALVLAVMLTGCGDSYIPEGVDPYGATPASVCGTDMECTAYCLDHEMGTAEQCADPFYNPGDFKPDIQAKAYTDLCNQRALGTPEQCADPTYLLED